MPTTVLADYKQVCSQQELMIFILYCDPFSFLYTTMLCRTSQLVVVHLIFILNPYTWIALTLRQRGTNHFIIWGYFWLSFSQASFAPLTWCGVGSIAIGIYRIMNYIVQSLLEISTCPCVTHVVKFLSLKFKFWWNFIHPYSWSC